MIKAKKVKTHFDALLSFDEKSYFILGKLISG
jgi:hypothetical protein